MRSPALVFSRLCRLLVAVAALLATTSARARTLVSADGPGGVATYQLLGQTFGVEVPDCKHMVPHITEELDPELGKNVFVFALHVAEDDDRCMATDRQRTEIRGKIAAIVGNLGETVHYRWKFRLPEGFQTSPNFTHIFQIKSDASSPVMTLTPRSSTIAIDGGVGVRGTTALAPFLGNWVVVQLSVVYGTAGHIDMTIRRLTDGQTLLSYAGDADTWQASDTGHDPKFGIYRSLSNPTLLRDEQVRFADFCISKVSAAECDDGPFVPPDAGPDAARDAGAPPPPPPPDASAPPPDLARDMAVIIPPPPPPPPPPADASTVPPPKDAAVVVPPSPDASAIPADAAVVAPPPADAAPDVRPDARPDASGGPGRRPPSDAAIPGTPDASVPDPSVGEEVDGSTGNPLAGNPGPSGGGRARRPGQRGGCQMAVGGEPERFYFVLVLVLVLGARRRASSGCPSTSTSTSTSTK
jgi:hypothetical protein